jgi:hypothetical protein
MISKSLLATALAGFATGAASYEELGCESLPPTCWLCEHPVQVGTTYAWWDDPPATGEFLVHTTVPGWRAEYHCFTNNGYSVVLYSDRQQPTPSIVARTSVSCSLLL